MSGYVSVADAYDGLLAGKITKREYDRQVRAIYWADPEAQRDRRAELERDARQRELDDANRRPWWATVLGVIIMIVALPVVAMWLLFPRLVMLFARLCLGMFGAIRLFIIH